ncbi:hypothetical protein LguiA_029223 [Lonicera macranthoides]
MLFWPPFNFVPTKTTCSSLGFQPAVVAEPRLDVKVAERLTLREVECVGTWGERIQEIWLADGDEMNGAAINHDEIMRRSRNEGRPESREWRSSK